MAVSLPKPYCHTIRDKRMTVSSLKPYCHTIRDKCMAVHPSEPYCLTNKRQMYGSPPKPYCHTNRLCITLCIAVIFQMPIIPHVLGLQL